MDAIVSPDPEGLLNFAISRIFPGLPSTVILSPFLPILHALKRDIGHLIQPFLGGSLSRVQDNTAIDFQKRHNIISIGRKFLQYHNLAVWT